MADDSQDFEKFVMAELEGSAGDTADTATPTEAAPESTPAEVEQQPADTSAPAETGEEWRFNSAEWDEKHPDLATYRRQLQGDHTRAMQQLAEQRRAVEGIPNETLTWARRLEEVAAISPQAAAQMLADAQRNLLGEAQPEPQVSEYDDDLWTPNEIALRQQNQALQQRLERIEQQTTLASIEQQVTRQFDGLEAELGVKIPHAERLSTLQAMNAQGLSYQAAAIAWKATHGWKHALDRGRKEGEQALRAKQSLPAAPTGIASREAGSRPDPKGMDLTAYLEAELAGQ